jgi:1-acyl-sn-glycerol-3-phosphate acyltransferase
MLFTLRMLLLTLVFMLAGLLGLLLGICRPFNPDNSRICALLYSWPALRILGLKVQADTQSLREHVRGAVIVANHQSNYDLFVVGSVVPPRTVSLGKKSLKWVPVFGQLYWLSGNVLLDRGNAIQARQAMTTITETLQHKDTSIWVFAEGTRNMGKGLLPFKKGAFQMAIAAGAPIIQVCTSSYMKHMRLNRLQAGTVLIRSLPPISTIGMTLDDVPELMQRCHQQMHTCIAELDARIEACR